MVKFYIILLVPHVLMLFWVQAEKGYMFTEKEPSSYLQFKQWDAMETGRFAFKFKVHSQHGLLMYSDNSKGNSKLKNSITVKLVYGRLEVTIQIGLNNYQSKRTEKLGKNLNDRKWHTVELIRCKNDPRMTTIKLGHEMKHIIIDGNRTDLTLNTGLFFGGISKELKERYNLVDRNIKSIPRLIGCIKDIQFTRENVIQQAVLLTNYNVTEGCRDACVDHHCPNNGKCMNFFTRAGCDCIGTGYNGPTCEKESKLLSFSGQDYMTVDLPERLRKTNINRITVRFKTTKANGVMLVGWSDHDFIALELHYSVVRLTVSLGRRGHYYEIYDEVFNNGMWHTVDVSRKKSFVVLTVDNKYSINGTFVGQSSILNMSNKLFIGGYDKLTSLNEINIKSNKNFKGCLQDVFFNDLDIVHKFTSKNMNFRSVGNISRTCSVQKVKSVNSKDIGHPIEVTRSKPRNIDDNDNSSSNSVEVAQSTERKKLSKNFTTWIVVGLVCGGVILLITIIVIVHNIRHRYSFVFYMSRAREKYHKQIATDGTGTLLYQPPQTKENSNKNIQPHLV